MVDRRGAAGDDDHGAACEGEPEAAPVIAPHEGNGDRDEHEELEDAVLVAGDRPVRGDPEHERRRPPVRPGQDEYQGGQEGTVVEMAIDSVNSTPSHCATSGVRPNARMTANPTTGKRRPRRVVATTAASTSQAATETSHCA